MSKIALVTGAAGGIGRASVEKFAAEGWTVLATDRVEASGFPKGVTFHELEELTIEDWSSASGRTLTRK